MTETEKKLYDYMYTTGQPADESVNLDNRRKIWVKSKNGFYGKAKRIDGRTLIAVYDADGKEYYQEQDSKLYNAREVQEFAELIGNIAGCDDPEETGKYEPVIEDGCYRKLGGMLGQDILPEKYRVIEYATNDGYLGRLTRQGDGTLQLQLYNPDGESYGELPDTIVRDGWMLARIMIMINVLKYSPERPNAQDTISR